MNADAKLHAIVQDHDGPQHPACQISIQNFGSVVNYLTLVREFPMLYFR
jgi:hypothetical protein